MYPNTMFWVLWCLRLYEDHLSGTLWQRSFCGFGSSKHRRCCLNCGERKHAARDLESQILRYCRLIFQQISWHVRFLKRRYMFCEQVLCFQVYGICQQCFAWTKPRDWNGNSARPGDTNWEDMKWKNKLQKHHQYTLTKRIHCNAIICTCVTHTIHVWYTITECN